MVRRALAAAALFLTTTGSAAPAQVALGVRGGLSFARLAGDVDTDTRTRVVAGAFVSLPVAHTLHIQAELSYAQKGAKTQSALFDPELGPVSLEKLTTLDYLELQLPVGFFIPVRHERVRPRIYAGPALALALRCRVNVNVKPGTSPPPEDCASDTKAADFGVVAGIGLEYNAGPGAVVADVRYDVGVIDISDVPGEPATRNRSFQILVGYVRRL